ncbi:hypothetical protein [Paludisphaera mucosa]|uniref:Uncharacterized protein n=1 Tax=Paludisphaera mucosa TaxID=3030827 RepID=A0ABT6FL85_9BACT|nr:hypothetical protein [Paludisphaera mucosa]MDG3008340.1 hypothetical protein [Paludisphaera mucosa]
MIAYRDFQQKLARPGFFGLGKDAESMTFDQAVEAANDWIASAGIRVLNVETISLWEGGLFRLRVWHEGEDALSGE